MKIRTGFVSNSSSTSFTCHYCESTESYHDSASHRDYGFVICENYHNLCEDHLEEDWEDKMENYYPDEPNPDDFENDNEYEEAFEKWEENESDRYYDIPKELCPICQMKLFEKSDIFQYILKLNGNTIKEIEEKIRESFKSYDEFMQFLQKEKRKE